MSRCRVILLILLMLIGVGMARAQQNPDIRALFEQRCDAWEAWCGTQGMHLLTTGAEFNSLVDLGPPAAPYFVEKMSATSPREAAALAEALGRITKKHFPAMLVKPDDPAKLVALTLQWWKDGPKSTNKAFDAAFARWKVAKAKSKLLMSVDAINVTYDDVHKTIIRAPAHNVTDFQRAYDELAAMGIAILPNIIAQFQAKEYDLLPLFTDLTRNGAPGNTPADRAEALLKWWNQNKELWILPGK